MSSLSDSNTTDSYDNTLNGIMGGTDNTRIGNVNDSLKTYSTVNFPVGHFIAWSKKLRYLDMNATNGGVAREATIGTTFTNIFSYTGSGYLSGFNLCLEDKAKWYMRLIIDNEDIYISSSGIYTGDLVAKTIYGWEPGDQFDGPNIGFDVNDETIVFQSPLGYPIYYQSSISLQVKHESTTKKFRAGLICLSTES